MKYALYINIYKTQKNLINHVNNERSTTTKVQNVRVFPLYSHVCVYEHPVGSIPNNCPPKCSATVLKKHIQFLETSCCFRKIEILKVETLPVFHVILLWLRCRSWPGLPVTSKTDVILVVTVISRYFGLCHFTRHCQNFTPIENTKHISFAKSFWFSHPPQLSTGMFAAFSLLT